MKHILIIFIIFLLSLTLISCSSEDDAALKDGKVAATLSEADQLEPPYPSLTIKSAIQNIRVVRPIAYNKTIIETWSFRLKGAPDSMLKKTLLYSRLINSNGSMVGPDDLTAYFRAQQGLESEASDWIEMHRHFGKDEVLTDRVIGKGTSDLDVRTQYTAWREYMTEAA